MKKVVLDQEKCIGCGACVAIAPDNFDFEENLSKLVNDEVTESSVEAAEACPVCAITITGDECCCCDNDCHCCEGEECTCDDDCNCECDDCCTCHCDENEEE